MAESSDVLLLGHADVLLQLHAAGQPVVQHVHGAERGETMTKRELLENYRDIILEIKSLERQADFLNRDIGGPHPISSPQLTGMPRGTNDPEAAKLQRVDDEAVLMDIRMKTMELNMYLEEFNRIIDSILLRRTRNIIRNYYANGMTDEAIAKEYGLSSSRVNQIRLEFMKEIEAK